MYEYITKKQNSLVAKRSKKSNNLLSTANSIPKYIKNTQNQTIQFKRTTITRSFLSNLWSDDLYQFFNRHLPGVNVYLIHTDYVGGSWDATFTYDPQKTGIHFDDIDKVIKLVPRYRDN